MKTQAIIDILRTLVVGDKGLPGFGQRSGNSKRDHTNSEVKE